MKKLNLILWIFILFGSMLSGQAWETKVKEFVYGDATYYTALPQEVSVELDCIGRKHLDHDGIERKLSKAFKGAAGYYLQYDQVHRDIPIYSTQHTVILKDDLQLNTIIPSSEVKDITKSFNVTISMSRNQAETMVKSNLALDLVPQYIGLYWVKQEDTWIVGYLFKVFNSVTTGFDPVWVDASSNKTYGITSQLRPAKKGKNILTPATVNIQLKTAKIYPQESSQNASQQSMPIGTASLYWNYPEGSPLTSINAIYKVVNGNNILGHGEPLKYNPTGENNLAASGTNKFDFDYENQAEKYAKTFAFLKLRSLWGDGISIKMNVYPSSNPYYVGYNDGVLHFGNGFTNPAAMDEFWLVYGVFNAVFSNSGGGPSAIYNGYLDFLSQRYLGKIGVDHVCNHYGLRGPGATEYNTNSPGCMTDNTIGNGVTRNSLSTLLSQIYQDANLGPAVVSQIMNDILASQPGLYNDAPYVFIKGMWTKARALNANNTMTMAQLCALRSKINTYFSGCDDVDPDLLPITDQLTDVMIRDYDTDTGAEPHAFAQLWVSPDIWNTYQGKISEPVIGEPNVMHVRVKNIGCDPVSGQTLRVYTSFANMGLSWPASWTELDHSPIILGAGQAAELTINWIPPSPAGTSTDDHHFCILARVTNAAGQTETSSGQVFVETGSYGDNIKKNNGISLRNMTLIPKPPGVTTGDPTNEDIVTVIIQDPEPPTVWPPNPVNPDVTPVTITCVMNLPPPPGPVNPVPYVIDINNPANWDPTAPSGPGTFPGGGNNTGGTSGGGTNTGGGEYTIKCERGSSPLYTSDPDFFNKGEVWIQIKKQGAEVWGGLPLQGTGFITGPDGWIKMISPDFALTSLPLVKGEKYLLGVKYKPKPAFASSSFSLVLKNENTNKIIGGELYVVKESNGQIDINDKSVASRSKIESSDIVLKPNPAKDVLTIRSLESKMSTIHIYDMQGRLVSHVDGRNEQQEMTIDIRYFSPGLYSVLITTQDGSEINKKFVKE